jgi:hypothetical protein
VAIHLAKPSYVAFMADMAPDLELSNMACMVLERIIFSFPLLVLMRYSKKLKYTLVTGGFGSYVLQLWRIICAWQ